MRVDLEEVVRDVVLAESLPQGEPRRRLQRRIRRRRILQVTGAVAASIVVAIATAAVPTGGREEELHTAAPSSLPPISEVPGWNRLDAGPLAPRQGAGTIWTDTELIVLGGERHHDGAAYSPSSRHWRAIAEPPLPDGVPQLTWTGRDVLAVVDSQSGGRHAAAYTPDTNEWRPLPDPPPARFPNLGSQMRPAFLSTPIGAVLANAWAAYDRQSNTWRLLPIPSASDDLGGHPAAVAARGSDLVVIEPGADTLILNLVTEAWTTGDVFPLPRNVVGSYPAAVTVGSELVVFADGQVAAWEGATWKVLHSIDASNDCVPVGILVDGRPGFSICNELIYEAATGDWRSEDTPAGCCYPEILGTAEAIFAWDSNDDRANDPTAPRSALWQRNPTVGDDEGDGGRQLGEEIRVTGDDAAGWSLVVRHHTSGDCVEIARGRNRSGGCGMGIPDEQAIALLTSGTGDSNFVFGAVRRDSPLVRLVRADGTSDLLVPMDPGPSFDFLVFVFRPPATIGAARVEIADVGGAVLHESPIRRP